MRETLRIRSEPVPALLVGQLFHDVEDFDLDGSFDTSAAQPGSRENGSTGMSAG
jgi:hypothetical protein